MDVGVVNLQKDLQDITRVSERLILAKNKVSAHEYDIYFHIMDSQWQSSAINTLSSSTLNGTSVMKYWIVQATSPQLN